MSRLSLLRLGCAPAALFAALTAHAQQPDTNSLPQPVSMAPTIPASRDVAYPGTITLKVDATDLARRVFQVTETIPVSTSGHLVLLFPRWLPGQHAPNGEIGKLAGLHISTGNGDLAWTRDPVDVSAFHIDVPAGAHAVTATFQLLGPIGDRQGRVLMTPDMLSLQWNNLLLYPAGYFARDIQFKPSAIYPKDWKSATALAPGLSGDRVDYPAVDLETLADSPAIAGRYMRSDLLAPGIRLDVAADDPDNLVVKPEQIEMHRRLVEQAKKLFGTQHFDHYDFLLTLSDKLGSIGLEHHRSSEDGGSPDYFTGWNEQRGQRGLLPHELTHSWNGKYRRPADLWTPDYRQPMQDTLLWVYEGLTQFWGIVLEARSGLTARQDSLDMLAFRAASLAETPGRAWRPLEDTTADEILAQHGNMPWQSYQRFEDYYTEGAFVWLEADQIIRERSGGKKSLDDFARAFFGGRDGDWGTVTYRFEDVVNVLNRIQPYDWAGFLHERIYQVRPQAPLGGITRAGYRLIYQDEPTPYLAAMEAKEHFADFTCSLGFRLDRDGKIKGVRWGGPAYDAGLVGSMKIISVGERSYSDKVLKQAIKDAKISNQPIRLIVMDNDLYRTVAINWTGGLRYPALEKVGQGPSGLDALLTPKP